MNDAWEKIRHMTMDGLVTATKLNGSALSLNGNTTPEGWPFFVVVAVGKPGNERAVQFAMEFHERLTAAGAPTHRADHSPGDGGETDG